MSRKMPNEIPKIHRRIAEQFRFGDDWEDHLVIWVMPKDVAAVCVFLLFAGGFFLSATLDMVYGLKQFNEFAKQNIIEVIVVTPFVVLIIFYVWRGVSRTIKLNSKEDDSDLV